MASQAEMVDAFVPEDLELKLAHQLLSTKDGVSRKVLYELLGRPKRYSELKPALGEGKSENSLTVALKTLRRNGLVDQRTDARKEPVVHRYQITSLGIQTVLAIQRLQPIEQQLAFVREALDQWEGPAREASRGDDRARLVPSDRGSLVEGKPDVWHVTPNSGGGWRVKREGNARATRIVDTKEQAVEAARQLAMKRSNGRVTVHRTDGSIQRQITPSNAAT